ncbi:MAG: SpoIIE family protein phosphatase [Saccharofermentans sp.]|nr:SpoIIE family protein phosphatase [Saccharofermentans sp.]
MQTLFGIKLGGLKQKIVSLVIVIFLIMIIFITIVSVYRTRYLSNIVSSTREEQQISLGEVSAGTIHEVLDTSMTKSNDLQAFIADDMFSEIETDVLTLQALAEGYFQHKGSYEYAPILPPDPSRDGEVTAQALWDDTVEDYTESEYLEVAVQMGNTMVAMCTNAGYMDNCYIGFEDGTSLCVDAFSANKYDEDGNIIYFPARQRTWYQDAIYINDVTFSGVIYDTFSGRSCVTCSAPVFVNGELIGVVGIDLFLDELETYVEQSDQNSGFLCIVNDEGQVIFAPDGNGLFEVESQDEAEDLRYSDNADLAGFVIESLYYSTGFREITVNGEDYYMVGSPIPTVGWAAISVVEKDLTEVPTNLMLEEYDRINDEAQTNYRAAQTKLLILSAIMIFLIVLAGMIAVLMLSDRIVKPIESMTQDIIEGATTGKMFEMKEIYNTNDEIEVLAASFDDLSKKTKAYITEITENTKMKERISTELSLAAQIQEAMLPHKFPPFPDRHEFDIYAVMDPAREVGGDFYDFFMIDDDHIGLVMADVAGKGIPAALYMMISKTILQSCAMLGVPVSEVLRRTNNALCYDEDVDMFVTVWVGVLQISTGKLTACNAGHEYPVIKRADGSFEVYKDKHSLAIGAMPTTRFTSYEIDINKGDILFLYTDGVPEATDGNEKMFGQERMLEALNSDPDADPTTLLKNVQKAVAEFVKDAEPFDDLTMLAFEYHGPDKKQERGNDHD